MLEFNYIKYMAILETSQNVGLVCILFHFIRFLSQIPCFPSYFLTFTFKCQTEKRFFPKSHIFFVSVLIFVFLSWIYLSFLFCKDTYIIHTCVFSCIALGRVSLVIILTLLECHSTEILHRSRTKYLYVTKLRNFPTC